MQITLFFDKEYFHISSDVIYANESFFTYDNEFIWEKSLI